MDPNLAFKNFTAEEIAEYNDFFENACYEDMKEMADILGVTYQDHCHATKLRKYPDPPPNSADVDQIIKMVEDNSPECTEINLNNIKVPD